MGHDLIIHFSLIWWDVATCHNRLPKDDVKHGELEVEVLVGEAVGQLITEKLNEEAINIQTLIRIPISG